MVLFFSATGNTEFIAKEIAKRIDDECVNLLERVKNQDFSPIHSEKPLVICAPVYVCEIPRFMTKYLKKLSCNLYRGFVKLLYLTATLSTDFLHLLDL